MDAAKSFVMLEVAIHVMGLADFGSVVIDNAVAVIDRGAFPAGAALIHGGVKRVTDQPVRWVIRTGSRDHRWLGNSDLADWDATIHAWAATVETREPFAERHAGQGAGADGRLSRLAGQARG